MTLATTSRRGSRPRRDLCFAGAALLAGALLSAACTTSTNPAAAPGSTTLDRAVLPTGTGTTTVGNRPPDADPNGLSLEAVSTRAEYVTGGDVVVAAHLPAGTPDDVQVSLTLNGSPIETTWTEDRKGRMVTTVRGLREGANELRTVVGPDAATLVVTNHPTTGPLFSGPALPMPVCSTNAYGLGPATDANCSAPTKVSWTYKSTDGTMKPLDDPTSRPADLATITSGPRAGKNHIVREEAGVLNRSIYWINVLDPEPGTNGPAVGSTPSWDASGWNGRLVYQFGGGCGTTYTQGFLLLASAPENLIEQGYATATGTLNTFQVMCNDVLSAETALVVKEHFSEAFAPPVFTIGSGGSGGAIQQYLIAQNYPGILDAVGATLPFPDALSIAPGVVDCVLLNAYYRGDGASLTTEQRSAINGHLSTKTCDFWEATFAQNIKPDTGCALDILGAAGDIVKGLPKGSGTESGVPKLPEADRYDAETNPDGLRCTLQDGMVNVLGKDPATGFARRPLDNTGVVYGLDAVNRGVITVDQLLDLNERVGGTDVDGRPTPERMAANEADLRAVYETGRVIENGGPLDDIPVITVNVYTDDQGDIHDRFRAFSLRDRLAGPDGTPLPNHMLWTRGVPAGQSMIDALTGTVDVGAELVDALDQWLTALAADTSSDPLARRLETARPALAVDNCLDTDGTRVSGFDIYESGPCHDRYPIHGDTRTAAGAPRRNDIGKCQLQSVDAAFTGGVITATFTAEQRSKLTSIFPDGVCDWSRTGVGQVPSKGPWQSFGS